MNSCAFNILNLKSKRDAPKCKKGNAPFEAGEKSYESKQQCLNIHILKVLGLLGAGFIKINR